MKKLFTFLTLLAFTQHISAQVLVDLAFDTETEIYTVSLLPQSTWEYPHNITGTGQITLRVPTGEFVVQDLANLQTDVEWLDNARSNSPSEAPDYDYISFGLMTPGTSNIPYVANEMTPLFSFKNELGCTGGVSIMENEVDPFYPPNQEMVNAGNSLSVLGGGSDAYAGNVSSDVISCETVVEEPEDPSAVQTLPTLAEVTTYPNPAVEQVTVDFQWDENAQNGKLIITDNTGKQVKSKKVDLQSGENQASLRVKSLSAGIYFLQLENKEGMQYSLGKFIRS